MKIAATLGRNIVFVWLGFASHVVTTMVLTPMMIARLGQENYGLWIFLQTLIGYYGLIDIGLRAGVTQSVTRKIATGSPQSLVSFLNGILPLLWKIAVGIVVIGLIASMILPYWIEVKECPVQSLSLIVAMQSFGVAFTFCCFPFGAILTGMQRYDLSETIAVVTRLLSAISTYFILANFPNLLFISMSMLLFNVLDQVTRISFAYRLIPELKVLSPRSDKAHIKELVTVGGWNFLCQVSHLLLQSFHIILAGILFSIESVVPFSLGKSLAEYCNRLVGISSRVLFPMFVYLEGNRSGAKSKELFFATCRISISFSGIIFLFGLFWLVEFLNLWLNDVNDREGLIFSTSYLFVVFSMTMIFENLRGVASQFVAGKNELPFLGRAMLIESVLSVAVATLLGVQFGLIGIAMGNLIAYIVTTLSVHIPKYKQLMNMSYWQTATELCVRPICYLLLVGASLVLIDLLRETTYSLRGFIAYRILPTIVTCLLFAPLLFTRIQNQYLFDHFTKWFTDPAQKRQ